MHIGLIGGIGPAATDFYYKRLIAAFAARGRELDMTIVHADSPTLIANLDRNDIAAQVAIYRRLTDRLVAAEAECVVVTSIAGHFCIDAFKDVSPLSVIDMTDEVREVIRGRGLTRIGILGTRTAMETRFYGRVDTAEIVPPPGTHLEAVHRAYVDMATVGRVSDDQRAVFSAAVEALFADEKVEAIMLGGTDLALVYSEQTSGHPLVDCAAIHADAVARIAMSGGTRA